MQIYWNKLIFHFLYTWNGNVLKKLLERGAVEDAREFTLDVHGRSLCVRKQTLENLPLTSTYLLFCLAACKNLRTAQRIIMKMDNMKFYKNLSTHSDVG
jgi:hypothetical protein